MLLLNSNAIESDVICLSINDASAILEIATSDVNHDGTISWEEFVRWFSSSGL